MTLPLRLGIAGAFLVLLSAANADPINTYFGVDYNGAFNSATPYPLTSFPNANNAASSFITALGGPSAVSTETFDSGIALGNYSSLGIALGTNTATIVSPGSTTFAISNTFDEGRYAISSPNYLDATAGNFTINFSAPVSALGFYGTDIGDFGGQLSLSLTPTGGGAPVILNVNSNDALGNPGTGAGSDQDGAVLYFGFIDTTGQGYSSITFNDNLSGIDAFGFDNFSVAWQQPTGNTGSVPEPSSLVFVVGSLLGLAALRRRKVA